MGKRKLISVKRYAELSGLSLVAIYKRVERKTLDHVIEDGYIYIDITNDTVMKRQKSGRKPIPDVIRK